VMRFELLDHTADILVKAFGNTLEQCYANAAYAMFDQMVDMAKVDPVGEMEIIIEGVEKEELLYELLSELLYIHDVDGVVFSEFEVTFNEGGLRCVVRGEALDLGKHGPKTEIKAVTYHMLEVNEEQPSITVLFDI
jgi:SHS2 domain-containing protein